MHWLDRWCSSQRGVRRSRPSPLTPAATPALASWQTIGGCGAGSSGGIGGVKWIGRNVSGGLVNVQCQGSYTRYGDGYVYSLNNQLTVPLSDAFTVGVLVPYLYKWINDPLQLRIDYSNQGLGDVNGLITWKLGAIRATAITAGGGRSPPAPTTPATAPARTSSPRIASSAPASTAAR